MIHKQNFYRYSLTTWHRRACSQRGQAIVEYIVVCAALSFALFVPIQDNPASPDQPRTTWQVIVNGFQEGYRNISYAISLPE